MKYPFLTAPFLFFPGIILHHYFQKDSFYLLCQRDINLNFYAFHFFSFFCFRFSCFPVFFSCFSFIVLESIKSSFEKCWFWWRIVADKRFSIDCIYLFWISPSLHEKYRWWWREGKRGKREWNILASFTSWGFHGIMKHQDLALESGRNEMKWNEDSAQGKPCSHK